MYTEQYSDPEEVLKYERIFLDHMMQEGKLPHLELIEELPEDFEVEGNKSVVVSTATK